MQGKPNNLIQLREMPWIIKSYMQIQGADWTWNACIIQNSNLRNFQADLEYPDLYSFNRELK